MKCKRTIAALLLLAMLLSCLSLGVLAAEHDGAVRYPYTFLATEKDRMVLPSSHTLILLRRDAAQAVERFLSTGSFRRTARTDGSRTP